MIHYPEQSHAMPWAVPVLRSLVSSSALASKPHLPLDLVSISYLRSCTFTKIAILSTNSSPLEPPCIHAVITDHSVLSLGFDRPKTLDNLLLRLVSKLVDQ